MIRQLTIVSLLSILLFSSSLSGQSIIIIDTSYHFNTGNLKSVLKFTVTENDTIYEGPAFFYYITGDIWQSGSYENGDMHGQWITYYTDGTIKRKASYANGLKSGEVINFYKSGDMRTQLKCVKKRYRLLRTHLHLTIHV